MFQTQITFFFVVSGVQIPDLHILCIILTNSVKLTGQTQITLPQQILVKINFKSIH